MNTLAIALSALLGQVGDAPAATVQPTTPQAPMVATQQQRSGILGRRTTTTAATTATTTSTTGQRRLGMRSSERTPLLQGRFLGRNR